MNKTSFKNFFKSKNSKEDSKLKLTADMLAADHMIEDYRKLVQFLTVLLGVEVINKFK